ncbi:hypothetical protein ACQ4PT_047309 [Festuca glaucescens]
MEGDEAAAAVARIRVVRCPRCDKFLPELPAYSVYVCGGCGATLQAKKRNSGQASDPSDNGNVKYLEVLESVPETSEAMDAASADNKLAPNRMPALHSRSVYSRDNSRITREPSTSNVKAGARDDVKEAKYMRFRNVENGETAHPVRARGVPDMRPKSPISSVPPNASRGERHVDHHLKSSYTYSNREHANETDLDGPSRVRGLEKDRAELLRMLDELRDQVQQSCEHDPDPLLSCHHEGFYHQAACSCLHCYHQEFLPVQGTPLGFNDQRAPYLVNSYGAYPVDGPLLGQQRYNSRSANPSLQPNNPRANISKKPAQTLEPIAGGAPFTICYNCYEVLQLPKKRSLLGKEYKLRCGSCSHTIVVKLDGTRLDVSELTPSAHLSRTLQNNIGDNMGATADERLLPPYSFSVASHQSQEKDKPSILHHVSHGFFYKCRQMFRSNARGII